MKINLVELSKSQIFANNKNSCIYGQIIFNKDSEAVSWKGLVFSANVVGGKSCSQVWIFLDYTQKSNRARHGGVY